MHIKIKQLQLLNFKGIRNMVVDFEDTTTISGDNGTGKTTIFDAFTWLLFGKNGRDEKDFAIKTIENGVVIPQIDHTVTGILTVDGKEVKLSRTYAEKWTRRRGSETAEMTGHETTYWHNDTPVQAGEYATIINGMVPENLFKLLTSSTYFNSMKWQDRRQVLIEMAGVIGKEDIVTLLPKAQFAVMSEILSSGTPVAELRKQIAAKKKTLNDSLAAIAPRIDEVKRGTPEPQDYEAIKKSIYDNQVLLLNVENAITNQSNAYREETEKQNAIHKKIGELKRKIQDIEFEEKQKADNQRRERQQEVDSLQREISDSESVIARTTNAIKTHESNIEGVQAKLTEARELYSKVAESVLEFKEGEFICPACKRELEPHTIATRKEVMIADFEKSKAEKLESIRVKGTEMKATIEAGESEIAKLKGENEKTEQIVGRLKIALAEREKDLQVTDVIFESAGEKYIREQIAALELSLIEAPVIDIEGLKIQKGQYQAEIDRLKALASTEQQIKAAHAREKELKAEQKSLAQQLADLEKQEFAMAEYTKAGMGLVESRINDRFSVVRWKMFNTLINGGIEECCEATINGVSYPDVNSAGKIQAGIDCINALGRHYGHTMPCFVDNAESVNELPATPSQVIRLVVTKDKSLKIN